MPSIINRTLKYITVMCVVILTMDYAPDVKIAGWVTGYTVIALMLLLTYFTLSYIVDQWHTVMTVALKCISLLHQLWERYKKDAFDNIYAMSFFIGALGVGIIALQLNGVNSAVSQSFSTLTPASVDVMTIAYGATCIAIGLFIVMLPEHRTPYYLGVGLFGVYAAFQALNTHTGAVPGRGLLATLIVTALAYFAFKSMINHDVALTLREKLRTATIRQDSSNKLVEKMLEGSYGNSELLE
ncbi:MAG: hypothetical protein ACPG7F_01735 [Aggregatilineales bacterium]